VIAQLTQGGIKPRAAYHYLRNIRDNIQEGGEAVTHFCGARIEVLIRTIGNGLQPLSKVPMNTEQL